MGPIRAERLQAYADCLIAAVHQVISCRQTEIEYPSGRYFAPGIALMIRNKSV